MAIAIGFAVLGFVANPCLMLMVEDHGQVVGLLTRDQLAMFTALRAA